GGGGAENQAGSTGGAGRVGRGGGGRRATPTPCPRRAEPLGGHDQAAVCHLVDGYLESAVQDRQDVDRVRRQGRPRPSRRGGSRRRRTRSARNGMVTAPSEAGCWSPAAAEVRSSRPSRRRQVLPVRRVSRCLKSATRRASD